MCDFEVRFVPQRAVVVLFDESHERFFFRRVLSGASLWLLLYRNVFELMGFCAGCERRTFL